MAYKLRVKHLGTIMQALPKLLIQSSILCYGPNLTQHDVLLKSNQIAGSSILSRYKIISRIYINSIIEYISSQRLYV